MGIQRRTQIKYKQKLKRKNRRAKLLKAGKKPDEHFYDGVYVSKSS